MSSKSGEKCSETDEGKSTDVLRSHLLPVHGTDPPPRLLPAGDLDPIASGSSPDGQEGASIEGKDLERLRWDIWSDVQACCDVGSSRSGASASGGLLAAVCFAHKWSAEAVNAANVFQSVRDANECASFARLFIIDAGSASPSVQEEVARLRVGYTPAYVVYRPGGELLEFRKRGGSREMKVLVGHLSQEEIGRILRMASIYVREEEECRSMDAIVVE